MTTIENSSPTGEILNTDGTPNGQALTPEQLVRIEADKLALQSEYTRTRQALIEATATIAKADPSSINTIRDTKLQNSVVKQLYGFDTYEQAVAVLGNDFNAVKNNGNGDDDRTEKLERELKLIKYNTSRSEVENAIKDYKLQNPKYFVEQDAEDKLRDELKNISSELSPTERVKRASHIALAPSYDPTVAAYQALTTGTNTTGGNSNINVGPTVKEVELQKQIEAGRRLFGLPTPTSK